MVPSATTLPLVEREHLSWLVDGAVATHQRVDITRDGSRVAVLLGADDFDGLQETLAVLADQDLLRDQLAGVTEADQGRTLSEGELDEAMARAGRPTARR